MHSLIDQFGHPTALAFSPDGTLVASASSDGIARVWRTSDWGLQSIAPRDALALTEIDFSADGEHVVTSDETARPASPTESGTHSSC